MKKLVLAVAALGLISLTSCKKDYTCTCKISSNSAADISYTFPKVKKKDATSACDTWNSTYTAAGGSCSLK